MSLNLIVVIAWCIFLVVWFASSFGAKRGSRSVQSRIPTIIAIAVFAVLRRAGAGTLVAHDIAVRAVGTGLVLAGIALAIWARVYLGRNWGMPMTRKDEPELVTSGPYRVIRHPIYSGMLLALLGTALVTSLYVLIGLVFLGGYFVYSATVEERIMSTSFPDAYARYRRSTKMLIPFVL